MLKKIMSVLAINIIGMNLAHAAYTSPTIYLAPSAIYQDFYVSGTPTYESATGKLAAGGSIGFSHAYLGLEAFANPKPFNLSGPDIYKPSFVYGFSVLPGYNFDGVVLGYGRLGLAYANFTNLQSSPRGYQAGLGVEWAMYAHADLRGEYSYTRFDSVSGTGSINSNEFDLGIVFRL